MSIRESLKSDFSTESSKWVVSKKRKTENLEGIFFHKFILDIWEKIMPWCEARDVISLSCLSISLSQQVVECARTLPLEAIMKICSPNLRMINTGCEIPFFDQFEVIKGVNALNPLVEDNAGLTCLIMQKGITLRKLVTIAAESNILVNIALGETFEKLSDAPLEQTELVLITNNVFMNSRNKTYAKQQELAKRAGCEIPPIQQYVALCVHTLKNYQICLYGQNPLTWGRSSTFIGGLPLMVGCCSPLSLYTNNGNINDENRGCGGQRKLTLFIPEPLDLEM